MSLERGDFGTKIIGLTGGIGSGKTTVAHYFESLGVPVYIADVEARRLMETTSLINKVRDLFGNEIIENNILNREKIAQLVFNDKLKLEELNKIVHPAVKEHFYKWVLKHKEHDFVIKEAAVLFESGSYKECDKIILVSVPEEIRIERVMERDNISRENIISRIKNQWNDNQKKALSDYVIDNIDIKITKKLVEMIYKELKR